MAGRLEVVLELAERMGIRVRREGLGGEGGGLCTVRGERMLFVDMEAELGTRYEKTLEALAGLSELEGQYILPEIREELSRYGRSGERGGQ